MRLSHFIPLSRLNSAVFVLATDLAQLDRGVTDEVYRASALKQLAAAKDAVMALEAELGAEQVRAAPVPLRVV